MKFFHFKCQFGNFDNKLNVDYFQFSHLCNIKSSNQKKGKTMKFKFTDYLGNNYEVKIKARDKRKLNASKKATQIVLTEIADLIDCAAYHYKLFNCNNLQQYAQTNANNIIDKVL